MGTPDTENPPPDQVPASTTHPRAALVAATVASLVTPFMGSSVAIALPAIGRAFSLDAATLGWFVTVYLLAAATALVPIGRLADLHGRERVFSLGLVAFSASSLACALAPGVGWLVAARVLQGIGAAMVFGTSVALVASAYPPGRRGWAIGITVSAVYVGLSVGPFAGGLLTERLGWRSIFHVGTALGVLAAVVAFARLGGGSLPPRGGETATADRFDAAGAALYAIGLASLMYGISRLPSIAGWALTSSGAVTLAIFVGRERSASSPMLDVALFARNRVFAMSSLAALINYSATAGVTLFLSLFLQQVLDMGPQRAGLVLAIQPVVQALVSPWAGRLSDRVEARIVASSDMGTIVVGLSILAAMPARPPIGWIVACLVLLGVGFALFSSPNTNAIMSAVTPRQYGIASATVSTMRLTGQTLSTGIATMLFALYLGGRPLSDAPVASFIAAQRSAFTLFAAVCVLGTFASLARGAQLARGDGPQWRNG